MRRGIHGSKEETCHREGISLNRKLFADIHLTFNLIRGLSKALEDELRTVGRKCGLTSSQVHLLSLIYMEDGLSISTIAEYGLWHVSSAFHNVMKLEEAGLLVTQSNKEDERITEVFITEEGRRQFEKLISLMEDSRIIAAIEQLYKAIPESRESNLTVRIGMFLCEVLAGRRFTEWLVQSVDNIYPNRAEALHIR
jgi:MarR family protease production transcriptional regulator HPr